jgi:hypothetical protein
MKYNSPHPSPLPLGEGVSHLLPEGEGLGVGGLGWLIHFVFDNLAGADTHDSGAGGAAQEATYQAF